MIRYVYAVKHLLAIKINLLVKTLDKTGMVEANVTHTL